MRIANGGNPYIYQQRKMNDKQTDNTSTNSNQKADGFATLYADMITRPKGTQVRLKSDGTPPTYVNNTYEFGVLQHFLADNEPEPIGREFTQPRHPDSIYEIPLVDLPAEFAAVFAACDSIDTTVLSREEVFSRIKEIFTDYFGEDFLLPRQSLMMNSLTGECHYHHVGTQFLRELREHGFDTMGGSSDYIEFYGYTGMSKSEMRAAVRDKFPEQMTLRDCMVMSWELGNLGLESTDYGLFVRDSVLMTMFIARNVDTDEELRSVVDLFNDTILDMPADFDVMKSSFSAFELDNRTFYGDEIMADPIGSILRWFSNGSYTSDVLLDKLEKQLFEV
jgi:hypothetical protein